MPLGDLTVLTDEVLYTLEAELVDTFAKLNDDPNVTPKLLSMMMETARDMELIRVEWKRRRPAATGSHLYLSTGCYHGEHEYCQSMTGYQGSKRPGQCKFCSSMCICTCHQVAENE